MVGGGGVKSSSFLRLLEIATNMFSGGRCGGKWRGCTDREGSICPPVVRYNRRQETVGLRYSMLLQIMEQCYEFPVYLNTDYSFL
jgi:hypothetical protein